MHNLIRTSLLLVILSIGMAFGAVPKVGSTAPEFGGTKFYNLTPALGSQPSLASLRGKVVLIDFWATWCGPCVASIPHLVDLHEKYADKGLVIIGHTDDSSQGLEGFIKKKNIPYLISVGKDIGGEAYGVRGIPHAFVIDPDGKVAWEGHPAGLEEGVIEKALKNVRMSSSASSPAPTFDKPSTVEKVAKLEKSIAEGKIGFGYRNLEKYSSDKDTEIAEAAKQSIATIDAWKKTCDEKLAEIEKSGDVYAAAEYAGELADGWSGHDAGKPYKEKERELKNDPAYSAGKEFQKLLAVPEQDRKESRFTRMLENFLKKNGEGYYAEQAKKL